jgi:hypothetical protein
VDYGYIDLNLNIAGDYVYYLKGNTAYYAKKDGSGSPAKVSALPNQEVSHLWVTEDGFIYLSDTDTSRKCSLNYVDSSGGSGSKETLADVYSSLDLDYICVAFMDDYVYYLSHDYWSTSKQFQIRRVPLSNLEAEPETVYTYAANMYVYALRAADGMIYAIIGDVGGELFGYNVSSGESYEYYMSDLLGEEDRYYENYTLNVGGGYVYVSGVLWSFGNTESIYRIPVSDFKSGTISAQRVYSTTEFYGTCGVNLLSEDGDMTFCAFKEDMNRVMVIMSMDGSDPVILGGN